MPETTSIAPPGGPATLFDGYGFPAGSYDELCTAPGKVRQHWSYLAGAFNGLDNGELQRRREEAWRQIRDNDVTFNIYGDPRGMGRPWELDLIPLLIGSDEWRRIELGLMQRAELLNLVLCDIYGERSLVRKGLLPPELVYAHPGFLRPCVGIPPIGERSLVFYAADLVRSADGDVRVLGDRAQAPSGAGYALENRMVVSRVLPSLFRDSHVHRLANYFRAVRQTLGRLSPSKDDDPAIVLLTAGPANEAYFEHAYLAGYLGYTLVQGSDLRVRDGRVWLETLDGPRPVDVILRRMDDNYCDPVELREDSRLGVPGLVHVARTGKVAIANPLGSGLLESPALMAFLPALGRHFLGEDLRLPSVSSWWCGDATARDHVLANIERLVIKPVHPGLGFRFVFGHDLSRAERDTLRAQIRARPHLYVGQEPLLMSTVPVLVDHGVEPRRSVLRSFLVADEHEFQAMPGGLTRVSLDADKMVVSNQAGGSSKDTWVLASEPERKTSLWLESRQSRNLFAAGGELPGRVADNLFWLGRYAERAEFSSRLLRLALQYLLTGEDEESVCLDRLLAALMRQAPPMLPVAEPDVDGARRGREQDLVLLISEEARLGSLAHTLSALLFNARSARDRLSGDTWRVVNDIDAELRSLRYLTTSGLGEALDEMDNLVRAFGAFAGLTQENMTRGRGWLFLDTGRRIERALLTCGLLDVLLVPAAQADAGPPVLEAVLATVDSLMSYRRRYRQGLTVENLLELIVCNERNPRSLVWQLSRVEEHVGELPGERDESLRSEPGRLALEATTLARLADVRRLAEAAAQSGRREMLGQFLGVLDARLRALSDALTGTYFRAAEEPHQLLQQRSGDGA
jgi:uncharacterized circularly permuted ATP-grasp superfamily protein/uncharacterized alpha-E superfamily protein